jgi:hypothetical protein
MNTVMLLIVLCPILGGAVVASVAAMGVVSARLLRFAIERRARALESAATGG